MDTTNYPQIAPGLRWKYTANMGGLAGQVRLVGPLDGDGGAHSLSEDGERMDYVAGDELANPSEFWAFREPVGPHAVAFSPDAFEVSRRATVTLGEPVRITQQGTEYEVAKVIVAWSFSESNPGKWYPRPFVRGHRVLKSGALSKHATSLYASGTHDLEMAAIKASRPTSIPSITWSN